MKNFIAMLRRWWSALLSLVGRCAVARAANALAVAVQQHHSYSTLLPSQRATISNMVEQGFTGSAGKRRAARLLSLLDGPAFFHFNTGTQPERARLRIALAVAGLTTTDESQAVSPARAGAEQPDAAEQEPDS